MADLIDRQTVVDALTKLDISDGVGISSIACSVQESAISAIQHLPSVQPTLYGYNVEHLELIARVLQKENLPPERVAEALTDIGGIVAIVKDEFEETLRRAAQNVEWRTER